MESNCWMYGDENNEQINNKNIKSILNIFMEDLNKNIQYNKLRRSQARLKEEKLKQYTQKHGRYENVK